MKASPNKKFGCIRLSQQFPPRLNTSCAGKGFCYAPLRMRTSILFAVTLLALRAAAVERVFNFSESPLEQTPTNFYSTVGGQGKPGDWKVILDEVAPGIAPLTANAPAVAKQAVLAQLARDPRNEHFPMLLFTNETFGDFKFSTRFKIVGGGTAQMAGIVFRERDEKNYYVLTASALDNRFWFFKVVDGQRGPLIGPSIELRKGDWHEMTVECEGAHILCSFDGKQLIPTMTDDSFTAGKLGFWTKSDSVTYFADAKITYERREVLAQSLVNDATNEYPRLLGLKVFAARPGEKSIAVVASNDQKDLGAAGTEVEQDVIRNGKSYYAKAKGKVTVTVPLRDRNGDPIAAVAVILKSFPGETQDTAALRAQDVVKKGMQPRVASLEDLLK